MIVRVAAGSPISPIPFYMFAPRFSNPDLAFPLDHLQHLAPCSDDTWIHSADSSAHAQCGYIRGVVTHSECGVFVSENLRGLHEVCACDSLPAYTSEVRHICVYVCVSVCWSPLFQHMRFCVTVKHPSCIHRSEGAAWRAEGKLVHSTVRALTLNNLSTTTSELSVSAYRSGCARRSV